MNQIVSETALSIIAEETTDSTYIDSGDELNVREMLFDILTRTRESVAEFEANKWESVFWNPGWARPDKVTNFLNEAFTKSQNDSDSFVITDTLKRSISEGDASSDLGIGVNILKFLPIGEASLGLRGQGRSSETIRDKIEANVLLNSLSQHELKTQWTGEKFEVKPMDLYR